MFHALVSGRLAPVSPVVPRDAANLWGGGIFRRRLRPRLEELNGPSLVPAVVDEWRASFDVCDWRSCGSARRIPVVEAMSALAWEDSCGCVSACDVGGWVVVSSRARELETTEGVVELENETIFQASSSIGIDKYTSLPLLSSSIRAVLCLTSPSRKDPASGQLETQVRGGS